MIFDDIPRCCDCAHRVRYYWNEGTWWGGLRQKERWGCTQGRPMYDCHGVKFGTDPEQMRLTGPCGHEGKLFRPVLERRRCRRLARDD